MTILSGIVIFFVGVTYSIYETSREATHTYSPYDIMYMEMADKENLSRKELYAIIDQESTNMTEAKNVGFNAK